MKTKVASHAPASRQLYVQASYGRQCLETRSDETQTLKRGSIPITIVVIPQTARVSVATMTEPLMKINVPIVTVKGQDLDIWKLRVWMNHYLFVA